MTLFISQGIFCLWYQSTFCIFCLSEHGGDGEKPRELPAGCPTRAAEGDGLAAEEDRSSWTRSVAWNAELCRQSIGFSTLLTRFPRCAFSVLIWRHLLHLVSTATAGDGYSPEVTAVHAVLTSVLGLDWISFVSANSIQFSHIYTSLRLTVYLLDLYFFNLYTSYFLIANSVKLYCKCCYLSFQKIKF